MSERHHQHLKQKDNVAQQNSVETTTSSTKTPPSNVDWEQERKQARVRQFLNIIEQLPRLCSPTICGTLSQPTTKTEKATLSGDTFEWSLEQKAILSPANITMDTDGTDEWQHRAELNPSWLQHESETFFSQRTIAPSPLITTTPLKTRALRKKVSASFNRDTNPLVYDEDDEEGEADEDVVDDDHDDVDDIDDDEADRDENDDDDLEYDDNNQQAQDLTTNNRYNDTTMNYSGKFKSYEFEDDIHHVDSDTEFDLGEESHVDDIHDDDGLNQNNNAGEEEQEHDETHDELMDDNLFFSPQPLRSSQTQQRMDIFSPNTFVRVMEDENTLQSTPKTTGSLLRTRTKNDVTD